MPELQKAKTFQPSPKFFRRGWSICMISENDNIIFALNAA